METKSCPCCSSYPLLRHARRNQLFWYCPSCRQEMMPLNQISSSLSDRFQTKKTPPIEVL